MGGAQEFVNSSMLQADSQKQDTRLIYYGHVTTYDPEKGAARVLIPALRDVITGNPVETNYLQVNTIMAGNGWGFQYHLKGGATAEEPELGEQVELVCHNRQTGLFTISGIFFHTDQEPPGNGGEDENAQPSETEDGRQDDPRGRLLLEPGEFVLRHESASFLKFYTNGSVQLFTADDLDVYVKNNLNLVVREGNLNATVEQGNLVATIDEGDATIEATLGNVTARSTAGSILAETVEGNIEASTTNGAVNIHAGADVTVDALGIITLTAPSIIASLNPADAQVLCNLAFLEVFNGHTHSTGAGFTGPPVPQAEPGLNTTVNFLAG